MASKGAVDCILKEKQALARQKDLFWKRNPGAKAWMRVKVQCVSEEP